MRNSIRPVLFLSLLLLFLQGTPLALAEEKASLENRCGEYGLFDYFLPPEKPLKEWYHYFVDQFHCQPVAHYFLTLLLKDSILSEKIESSQDREEFQKSLNALLELDWKEADWNEDNEIILRENLQIINGILKKIISKIPTNQIDLFREQVLIGIPSEFA